MTLTDICIKMETERGDNVEFRDVGLKTLAQANVLTTEETCSILDRTRQQLNNLLRKNEIEVFKVTSNGNLFWKPDVYELLRKINRDSGREYHEIHGYTTSKSVSAFRSLSINPKEVEQVYVFLSARDAIQKNFYNIRDVEMPDTLTNIEAARFIIIMNNEEEYWFDGLTCGYGGEGCGGSETVLSELGILERGKSRVNSIISSNKVLHFYRDNGEWKYEGEDSVEDDGMDYYWRQEHDLDSIESYYYRYNGNLVLTQGVKYKKTFGAVKAPSKEVLMKSLYFTPNPVTVEFLTKEEALKTGHFRVGYSETLIYQIIIKDISDRELWLTYPIEDILKTNPLSMREVYEVLGIEVEEETLPDKLKYLLGLSPRKIFGRYAVKGAI